MDLPAPVRDTIQGLVVRPKDRDWLILILGDESPVPFPGNVLIRGEIHLTYAFSLYFNDDALLPQFVLDDFRRSYTGHEAIRFLLQKGDTYPRADVIGVAASSGLHREHYVKEVDLGKPMKVALYRHETLREFVGFADIVVRSDHTQTVGTWKDIGSELDLPLLARCVPCIQVHPASILDALAAVAKP